MLITQRALTDRVLVAGFQTNPYQWMSHARLVVLCSDYEGMPNVLIESLICGTPVISTDCPSGPREILGDALPSALVPCGDARALADRIRDFLATPPSIADVDLSAYTIDQTVSAYEILANEPA
jgi:glycosyltransferase involved in cell wall biosynthesis